MLTSCLQTVQSELGFPEACELKAVFDKLLIYQEGQFFKPHQDSEKADEMVGTLVVILPSEYSGGTVTVEHRGEKKSFRRVDGQARELSLLAFYADCHHTVSPIKSGVRVALTYQLRLSAAAGAVRPSVPAAVVDRLAAGVQEHFAVPVTRPYGQAEPAAPERLVYLLDHEYTQRSLSWDRLKNGDRARVAALRAAAERLDCECFLGLAEVHEQWLCGDEDDGYRRYGRRRWGYTEEDELASASEEPELIELQASDIELNHWLDATGQPVAGIGHAVDTEELYFTKPSHDMDPFRSEHEGYQGNYGNTVDRWYHRAAFVMWPRANTFALRAQVSPQWAVEELLKMSRADSGALESRVKSLLPRWRSTAARVEKARFFAKVLKLSMHIDDSTLAHGWLLPLGMHRLRSQTMRRDLAALVDKHGLPWATELCTAWFGKHHWQTPPWVQLLAELCRELCDSGSGPCRALADWLLNRELEIARSRCVDSSEERTPWLDLDAQADEAQHLAHVFACAVTMSAPELLEETSSFLFDEHEASTSFVAQLVQACVVRSPELRKQLVGSRLHHVFAERFGAVVRAPARAQSDWTIDYKLHCSCDDCAALSQFLGSTRTELDWPLNQGRRQHIHTTIDSAKLPVLHTTRRTGSPYVLQLRKDDSLFSRERAYRAREGAPEITAGCRARQPQRQCFEQQGGQARLKVWARWWEHRSKQLALPIVKYGRVVSRLGFRNRCGLSINPWRSASRMRGGARRGQHRAHQDAARRSHDRDTEVRHFRFGTIRRLPGRMVASPGVALLVAAFNFTPSNASTRTPARLAAIDLAAVRSRRSMSVMVPSGLARLATPRTPTVGHLPKRPDRLFPSQDTMPRGRSVRQQYRTGVSRDGLAAACAPHPCACLHEVRVWDRRTTVPRTAPNRPAALVDAEGLRNVLWP